MKRACLSLNPNTNANSVSSIRPVKSIIPEVFKINILSGVFILLLCSYAKLNAQNDPIKWGVLLPDDIKMTSYTPEPGASAVILCDYGVSSVGSHAEFKKITRIKILKEAGLEYARVEIPYRSYEMYDNFYSIKAHTINTSSTGNVVKTSTVGAKIVDIEVDSRHRKKIINFLDVKPGSIIEYTYTLSSWDIVKLNNWYFQSTIPTLWSEYRLNIPGKLNYLVSFQKGRNLNLKEQQDYSSRLQFLYSNPLTKVYSEIAANKNILYESPEKTIKVYLSHGESMRFVMEKVPSVTPKPYNNDVFPFVKAHLYKVEKPYFIPILTAANQDYDTWEKWENRYYQTTEYDSYWLPTWEEATQNWIKSEYLGYRVVQDFAAKGELDAIAHTDSSNVLQGVYQFVKNNIKWDGTYSIYAVREFGEELNKKSGNSGEINLLLINLLRKAGFKVTPVLIRTGNLGRIENLYPEKDQFNHVIAQVVVNGKVIYLDATSDKNGFELPDNVSHTVGWLLKEKDFRFVEVDDVPRSILSHDSQI